MIDRYLTVLFRDTSGTSSSVTMESRLKDTLPGRHLPRENPESQTCCQQMSESRLGMGSAVGIGASLIPCASLGRNSASDLTLHHPEGARCSTLRV